MKKNLVIVSHSLDETITQCILQNKKNLGVNTIVISLQELMAEYDIADEVRDAGTLIQWIRGSANPITNRNYVLLNRVLYVPSNLFKNFTKSDREYAARELEAYMGFAFNAFFGVGNKLAHGICVNQLSLPQQWQRVTEAVEINVPNYYWGLCDGNPLETNERLVYSTIYNFLNWSNNLKPIDDNHVFCFEKPQGQPVFILSIGNKQLITSDSRLTPLLQDKIKQLACKINSFFQHFISEMVIFVDGAHLTFGCINPEIIRSKQNDNFERFVCHHLISEFYTCMN